jgi:peptidoglycan/xylan/chitin deacetylase (PgdA/CDA1 family)
MYGARAEVLAAAILATSMLAIVSQPVHALDPDCQRCVAFRLDDIQDYYYANEQRKFIEMFLQNNVSLTISIIGGQFGEDEQMVDFIGQYKNDSRIEIANHGWLHEDFGLLNDTASQEELLQRANERIHDTLGQDVLITTFVAPLNNVNKHTYEAVANSGLYIISAYEQSDTIFVNNRTAGSDLYHLPMTVEPSIFMANESSWQAVPVNEILAKIDDDIRKYGNSVVMVHPWDSIDNIQSVITHIQDETDYKIVTLREMAFGENDIPEGLNAAILAISIGGSFMAIRMVRNKMGGSKGASI